MTSCNPCQPRPLATALRYALWGASMLPAAAFAQSVPSGNTNPVSYSNTGVTPPDQTTVGVDGTAGGVTPVFE